MQLIPIFSDNIPCEGLLIIDTEGLGAPEFKEDNTRDNEIATFVLGISDLAIINVRGEVPTNIENFLQVSTCALMRMSLVDFHPSVVFVHQNCDPTSKEKNLSGRHSFMKVMDKVVSTQAKLIQKQDRFSCFQDVVIYLCALKKMILFISLNSLKLPHQCLHQVVTIVRRAPILPTAFLIKCKKILKDLIMRKLCKNLQKK